MLELIFATNNQNKLIEVQKILGTSIIIKNLSDLSFYEDIPETMPTIEGNASQKSHFIFDKYHKDCFADDTGLEVDALEGHPGVHSARYAGEERNFEKNIDKLLEELKDSSNRNAHFKTIISLILDGKEYLFEGIIEGEIIKERRGTNGFGYDSVFLPKGYNDTFAEMSMELKNTLSHRYLAINKMKLFLDSIKK